MMAASAGLLTERSLWKLCTGGDCDAVYRGSWQRRLPSRLLGAADEFLNWHYSERASIGLINSFGNLGGFAGPYVVGYLSTKTGSYYAGVLYLSASALIASFLILALRATRKA